MIPNTARNKLISGLPGTISHDGPTRALSAVLDSGDADDNVFGRAFTHAVVADSTVQAGGSGAFAGIMIHPHAYAVDSGVLPNGRTAEFVSMGEVFVAMAGEPVVGDPVFFDTDGSLSTDTGTQIQGAMVVRHARSPETDTDSQVLVVVSLTGPQPTPAASGTGTD